MAARLLLALLWLIQWLPLGVQALLGRGLGALLHALAGSRRRIALRNVELCFPEKPLEERRALVREHFGWLGRSLLERGLLWYASPERLRRLIHVEGDVQLAERSDRPVMWLVPHFMALDVAGASVLLFQKRKGVSIYQARVNDARGRILNNSGSGDNYAQARIQTDLDAALKELQQAQTDAQAAQTRYDAAVNAARQAGVPVQQ